MTARALVIEDDPASRRLTGATAKAHGVEGLLLHGPDTALPLAEPRRFQLGLFDYHMPGCDGLAPLQRMRASPGGAPGRCILLTADGTAATRQFVGPGLFDEVLLKPIPVARLSGILTALRTNA